MHENGRYVKLAQMLRRAAVAAAACALFLCAGTAGAEVVPGSQGAQDSLLAVAPDGSPRVAYVDASGAVVLAGRAADGTWALSGIPLAAGAYEIVGLAQAPAGADVLVETATGSRLVLAEQHGASWRVRTVASAPATGELGFGGLALDPSGRPLVAYASRLASQKSYLRLVHEAAAGKLVGEAVTKLGFPKTSDLPTVAPVVLANGTTRIVEAFDGATIEWARTKSHTDWTGQFLFANSLAQPAGVLRAVASPGGGAWSAWTELYPDYGESDVILARNLNGQEANVLDTHAFLVALVNGAAGPELAADDYVDLEGARTVYAGLVIDPAGTELELAGNLEGYAADAAGGRQYLLLDAGGVSWYRSPAPPTARVTLAAAADGATFVLTGRVTGATGGTVELDRETAAGAEPFATVPVATDGTFTASDVPPVRPLVYRAIYRDASGVPVAALTRDILGG